MYPLNISSALSLPISFTTITNSNNATESLVSILPKPFICSAPPIMDTNAKAATTDIIATITPANPIKPLIICSGDMLPSNLAAKAINNTEAPIATNVGAIPFILMPSLVILVPADDILLQAHANPTSINANAVIIPRAAHIFFGSNNVNIANAPTKISKDIAISFIALAFILIAKLFRTLLKLLTTLADCLITFFIAPADLRNTLPTPPSVSPTPLNTSPRPSNGLAKVPKTSPSFLISNIIAPLDPAANTVLQSIVPRPSCILVRISPSAGNISTILSLKPKIRPAIINPPIAYIIVDGE